MVSASTTRDVYVADDTQTDGTSPQRVLSAPIHTAKWNLKLRAHGRSNWFLRIHWADGSLTLAVLHTLPPALPPLGTN
jgi:hypothetical protein